MKKRLFNEEQDEEIYNACNTIRALMTVSSAMEGLKNPGQGIRDITAKTEDGSVVYALIKGRDWENLFQNKEWLSVLEGATNLNFMQNDRYKKHLLTITEFFPEETKLHIMVELL